MQISSQTPFENIIKNKKKQQAKKNDQEMKDLFFYSFFVVFRKFKRKLVRLENFTHGRILIFA